MTEILNYDPLSLDNDENSSSESSSENECKSDTHIIEGLVPSKQGIKCDLCKICWGFCGCCKCSERMEEEKIPEEIITREPKKAKIDKTEHKEQSNENELIQLQELTSTSNKSESPKGYEPDRNEGCENIASHGNKRCNNSIRGCRTYMIPIYLDFHQRYLCPYRNIINNEMCGKFNYNLIETKYRAFSIFEETVFCVKHYEGNIKITAQNVEASFVLECKSENGMKIFKQFYKHNTDTLNVAKIGYEYFQNGMCDWKITRIKEEYTTDSECSCGELYMPSDEDTDTDLNESEVPSSIEDEPDVE